MTAATIPYRIPGYEVVLDQGELPPDLSYHVGWFLIANRHLSTMEWSANQCSLATTQFLNNLLVARCILKSEIGERWENAEAAIINGMDHRAARVDEWLIDFTARQFNEEAPWPLIWRRSDGDT